MANSKNNFELFKDKMKAEGFPQLVIDTFLSYYSLLTSGDTGYICEADLDPVEDGTLPEYCGLSSYTSQGEEALKRTAIIQLNGGLGTGMGLDGPKCMLTVKNKLSFLDITVRQVMELNKQYGIKIPLILMNSFSTNKKTLELLEQYPEISTNIPTTFIQNKYPKILQDNFKPAQWQADPTYEWNPPGHGDVYISLVTSGILQKLLDSGIRYAFISNIDNLGATMDTCLLGYFAANEFPFMMEIIERTEMDKKGGHIARQKNGQLTLRERAQVAIEDIPSFEDINRYRFFNSNTIWINLKHLKEFLEQNGNKIILPLIANKKHLVPNDKSTPMVFQLETAMGSAISLFPEAQAVICPKERFKPVKKCNDLLVLWSDCFILSDNYTLKLNPDRKLPPITVNLDDKYYGTHAQLQERFQNGTPSLVNCSSLTVEGGILFGSNISIKGDVQIINKSNEQKVIPNGAVISKDYVL